MNQTIFSNVIVFFLLLALFACNEDKYQSESYDFNQDTESTRLVLSVDLIGALEKLAKTPNDPHFLKAISQLKSQHQTLTDRKKLLTAFKKALMQQGLNLREVYPEQPIGFVGPVEQALSKELKTVMQVTTSVLRSRLQDFGIPSSYSKVIENTNQLQLAIPQQEDLKRLKRLLVEEAKLEFIIAYDQQELGELLTTLKQRFDETLLDTTEFNNFINFLSYNGDGFYIQLDDVEKFQDFINRKEIKQLFPPHLRISIGIYPYEDFYEVLFLKHQRNTVLLATQFIDKVTKSVDQLGKPNILIKMTPEGANKFAKLTKYNVYKKLGFVINNRVYSAPMIQSEIPGGLINLDGQFSEEKRDDLVHLLGATSLPCPVNIIETF